MPETDDASSPPPVHIEETIQSIVGLHEEHHTNATKHQRFVDRITTFLGGADFIGALTVVVVGWVSLNGLAAALGYRALDPPPFAWMECAASLASLYLVILILTTQRGDDRLTQHRELLNLELTILSCQRRSESAHFRRRRRKVAQTLLSISWRRGSGTIDLCQRRKPPEAVAECAWHGHWIGGESPLRGEMVATASRRQLHAVFAVVRRRRWGREAVWGRSPRRTAAPNER